MDDIPVAMLYGFAVFTIAYLNTCFGRFMLLWARPFGPRLYVLMRGASRTQDSLKE